MLVSHPNASIIQIYYSQLETKIKDEYFLYILFLAHNEPASQVAKPVMIIEIQFSHHEYVCIYIFLNKAKIKAVFLFLPILILANYMVFLFGYDNDVNIRNLLNQKYSKDIHLQIK